MSWGKYLETLYRSSTMMKWARPSAISLNVCLVAEWTELLFEVHRSVYLVSLFALAFFPAAPGGCFSRQ